MADLNDFGGNPDRLTIAAANEKRAKEALPMKDRGDYMRDDPDPFAHFDGSWMDRD